MGHSSRPARLLFRLLLPLVTLHSTLLNPTKPYTPGQVLTCVVYCCNLTYCCLVAPEVERPVKKHEYQRKPVVFRVACILAIAATLIHGQPDWHAAHDSMKQWCEDYNKAHPYEQIFNRSHDHEYLKRYWENFHDDGSVFDAPRPGRRRKISREDALIAAGLVKQGKTTTKTVGRREMTYIRYYTSIAQAVRECPVLGQICHDYQATPEQLLAAMHYWDPTLVRRKVFLKHTFTPAELEERAAYAADMLQRYAADPTFLLHTIYIDEASILVSDKIQSDVHVWCEAHDLNFTDVCPISLNKKDKIMVRWICAVSAHPAFAKTSGLVYIDFTTGTTDIKRRTNQRTDGNPIPDWVYQVGMSLHQPEPVVAIYIHVITTVSNSQQQCLRIGHSSAIPAVLFSSICRCKHHSIALACCLQGC